MNNKELIYNLYFNEEKSLTEISNIINSSISYVSKVLRTDSRYIIEKEKRHQKKINERKAKQKELIYKNRKSKVDIEYINMKNQHLEATYELSKHSVLGNRALRKWVSSAYIYNKKKNRYEFDTKTLTKPADFPLYISNKI